MTTLIAFAIAAFATFTPNDRYIEDKINRMRLSYVKPEVLVKPKRFSRRALRGKVNKNLTIR
jgi:hypothetical protein